MNEVKDSDLKPIIIFGNEDVAQLAFYYFTQHAGMEVAGFTVDKDYLENQQFWLVFMVQTQ